MNDNEELLEIIGVLISKIGDLSDNLKDLVNNSSKIFAELVQIKSSLNSIASIQSAILNQLKINKSNI